MKQDISSEVQVSVVIPVYGTQSTLKLLTDKIIESCHQADLQCEIILVDDCGPGDTWARIQEIAKNRNNVTGILLSRNFGQHPAILAGLAKAKGKWIVVMDCDLQDDPAYIPDLFNKANAEELDYVLVNRGDWEDNGLRRFLSKSFYSFLSFMTGVKLSSQFGNFGIYHRRVINSVLDLDEQDVFLPTALNWVGYKRGELKADRSQRVEGESSYTFKKLLLLAHKVIVGFSNKPLYLSVQLGGFICVMSVIVTIIVLLRWLISGIEITGWTSLILSVWFLGGLIIAILGVQGVYLGRVFDETKKRPKYIISSITNQKEK